MRTPIAVTHIAVITAFKPLFFGCSVAANHTIAALGRNTEGTAGISGVCITVIAGFKIWVLRRNILTKVTITAARRSTGRQTTIGVISVAIITAFTGLNHAITATGWATFMTIVFRAVVAIIATLSGPDNAVTTPSDATGRQARIIILGVAIITGFITRRIHTQIHATYAVTAKGNRTMTSTCIVIVGVAVIARFMALITLEQIKAQMTVTASR
jgi:hypothetical protein